MDGSVFFLFQKRRERTHQSGQHGNAFYLFITEDSPLRPTLRREGRPKGWPTTQTGLNIFCLHFHYIFQYCLQLQSRVISTKKGLLKLKRYRLVLHQVKGVEEYFFY